MDASLDKVLRHFGNRSKLARALGINPQAVQQWERVPLGRALQIEELTSGAVTAREILEEQRAAA